MAAVVSHAMRRYPSSSQDTVYSSYSIRGEGSSWSNKEEGESALSRSMRYADPWLYGSMRGAPTRGGFVLAPAFVLCACPDYINGTKRSNKKGPSTCKKCKGTRVPLSSSDNTKFDTVRCYPTKMAGAHQAANTTSVRAGTMRVTSSSRPSILPATSDPYDLMRRSRLSTDAGSQYNRGRALSPAKGKAGESRSHSATRNKGTNNAAEIFTSTTTSSSAAGRRSILECNINPYELMSTEAELKPKDASITFLNGQRIRVRPPTYDPDYEDVIEQTQDGTSTKPLATKSPPNRRKPNTDSTSPKSNEKESECINRFKSILKKRTTFSDTDSARSPEPCPSPASFRDKTGSSSSHFYLPMPGTPRKKVQFLVENELACQDASGGGEDVVPDYEDVEYFAMEEIEQQSTNDVTSIKVPDVVDKKVCRLRRTTSERFKHEPRKVVFLDTMALRTKTPRNDSREAFGGHDLQKLDGLVSRTRKISLSKVKPEEPSPNIPIPDFQPIENGIKREINNKKTDSNEEDIPMEDATIMNDDVFIPEQANLTVEEADYQEVDYEEMKEIAKFIFFGDAAVSPSISPMEDIKNISPIVESIQVTAKNDEVNPKLECLTKTVPEIGVTPPSAPPRKRSGNKQPLVNIILTSQMPEIVPIELPKSSDYQNRTVVQINSPTTPVHKLQIRNEFNDSSNIQTVSVSDCPQRKTSILISGDDCYSTVNVNDDIPLYQSSVVVKDVSVDVIPIGNNRRSSSVYITGNFVAEEDSTIVKNAEKPNEVKTYEIQDPKVTKDEIEISCKPPEKCEDVYGASSELLKEMLRDPVEAVKRNLVPHVCGKSDMSRRRRDNKFKHSYPMIALNESSLEPLLSTRNDPSNNDSVRDTTLRLKSFNFETSNDDDKDMSSEHSSYTQYELIDLGSECYTDHSNRSSVTEEELANRTKFYDLLSDSALIEVSENEDHHYECIKADSDPIYEEIEIPPPLPSNPPPSSLIDDLKLDKEFTTRSIFEGASKYDILSYLVDAKERGIIPEDSYTYNFGNTAATVEDSKENYNGACHPSSVSDSSEDNSLIISGALIDEKATFPKASEIERNDSGVGSETSKSSLSKYRSNKEPSMICEDCEAQLDLQADNEPLLCRKCVKRRSERKEIITEIVETEEKYSRDLQIILEEFYQPMLVAGLLTPDQLSAIFLNAEELLENSQALAERLRDAVEIAVEQGDEDLLTINIGKLFLEAAPMLHAFETYCVRQGSASLLLASLEKDKELLRIFLRVSQMENTLLRRMNLNSFLMVPVQRVTKYPLLLARLFKVSPVHHETREQLKEAQHKIELHLNHMNSETKDVPSKLWRRIASSAGRRSSAEVDLVNIKLRKIAVDVLEWNHDEAKFALEGKLLFTQPTDNNWRKGRTIKLSPVNALLVINGKPSLSRTERSDENGLVFSRHSAIREAALLLVRDKNGRYSLLRDPLYLDRCVIAADPAWQSYFEVQELLGKDTFIFKAEDEDQTKLWYQQLQFHAQGMGAWRKRRNALANIMINGMGLRS